MWITINCFLIFAFSVPAVSGYVDDNAESLLRSRVFTHNNYNAGVRPVRNVNKSIIITIDITLHQIVDLNEKLQFLESQLWFRIYWRDEFLTWDRAAYGNLYHIQAHHSQVWTPDIEIYNEMGLETRDDRRNFPITINHKGEANWRFPRTLQTGCKIDMNYFPYDTQICNLDIGSWTLDSRFANVSSHKPYGDISEYVTSSEWKVLAIASKRHLRQYEAVAGSYSVVTFSIKLERRTNYYIFHMIFPCILISLVNSCSFLLPVSSGERISMSVTTLLGLVVFLLIVAEIMPPQSDALPIVDIYFGMCIAIVSISVISNVFVINIYFRGSCGSRIPGWVRALICRLGVMLRYREYMRHTGFTTNAKTCGYRDTDDDVVMGDEVILTPINLKNKRGKTSQTTRFDRAPDIFDCEGTFMKLTENNQFPHFSTDRIRSHPSRVDNLPKLELHGLRRNTSATSEELSNQIEWRVVAAVLDRALFVLFFVLIVSMTIFVVISRSSNKLV